MDIVSKTLEITDQLSCIISYDTKQKMVWATFTGLKNEEEVKKWAGIFLEQTQNDIGLFKDLINNPIN